MAITEIYQQELYDQFERNLPAQWFKKLTQRQGALYTLVWSLCGNLASLRESIESAQDMAIAATSEGFWLSLHMRGIGLERRAGESDAQGLQRYQFEFSPTRNTREGLLKAITTYAGLTAGDVQLETSFGKAKFGELLLRIETTERWSDIEWWWLNSYFQQWTANGLERRISLSTQGAQTVALPPWDFYTRFPTGPDLLQPFWQRPAFVNELRLIDFERQLENRSVVTTLGSLPSLPAAASWMLPTASQWQARAIRPLPSVPSALSGAPISRNLLAFVCQNRWNDDALRLREISQSLAQAQQPGQPFFYLGDAPDCTTLETDFVEISAPPFPGQSQLDLIGGGPWRLNLAGSFPETLGLAGQWWSDETATAREPNPVLTTDGYFWQLEFVLPRIAEPRYLSSLEITLGYGQPSFSVVIGITFPLPQSWVVPGADQYTEQPGTDPRSLNQNLPVLSSIYTRDVDCVIPAGVNALFLFHLSVPAP